MSCQFFFSRWRTISHVSVARQGKSYASENIFPPIQRIFWQQVMKERPRNCPKALFSARSVLSGAREGPENGGF